MISRPFRIRPAANCVRFDRIKYSRTAKEKTSGIWYQKSKDRKGEWGYMVTVKRILEKKKKGFWTVAPDTSAYEALQLMAENDVGALLVVGKEKDLLGIFTERDYSRKVVLKGKSSKDTPIGELMTGSVYSVAPDDPIEKCMTTMNDKRVRHLPVLERGKPVGLVSIRDVVNMIISEREDTIKHLKDYISQG
ncbi:MAG TPA: CBS domain-containing protein [Thermodesulfovibrionales bacterium]|nr:CBS domain-containing protein [Thermodesulfovibrionales bacterium]